MTRVVVTAQDGTQHFITLEGEIKNVQVTSINPQNEWSLDSKDTSNNSSTIRLIGGRERRG